MPWPFKDRAKNDSVAVGAGAFALGAASAGGFVDILASFPDNQPLSYAIQLNPLGPDFEVGIGHLSAGSLIRDQVIESSNGNALVNFGPGNKTVFVSVNADDMMETRRYALAAAGMP